MVSDYYKLLNLKRTATDAEINKAYRQQTKLWRSRLNAPDLRLRQEAELMLVELEAAKNVLLNTKSYEVNNHHKAKKSVPRKKKKFSPAKKIKLALNILTQGLSSAAQYILKLTVNYTRQAVWSILLGIWKTLKFVAIAIGFFLLLTLFLSGLGASISFGIGIYENQLEQALLFLSWNYFTMSIVTYFKYWEDKRKAKRNLWRTSEANLHSLELAGGWIGAFLAQVFLHHKSSKPSYQLVYWLIVVFHISLLLFFLPLVSPYAIPQKYILIINALLLIISLDGIRKKGIIN